ncbi:MAG: hypothetical protein H0T47_13795 [Planctomycetaceae bacterium]|nr:hypothetical protein [Planctomycetaceae bacterium]
MIQPEEIRRKAERAYPQVLRAWLDEDESLFPLVIRGCKAPARDDWAAAIQAVHRLQESSKEVRGVGYSIDWREVNSRRFGRNRFPDRLFFESREDLLRFIGKQQEFAAFAAAATRLRPAFPVLVGWMRASPRRLIEVAENLDGLLEVLRYFRDHPRPNRFARELPIPVDTKFIERHRAILRDWFDVVLPSHSIRADETHFERRYGLRYETEPHVIVRLLDSSLAAELRFPWGEISLPLAAVAQLPIEGVGVFIIENRVNLLTFPPQHRAIALEGRGCAVTDLRYVPWLVNVPVTYWGDLDVEGFRILSSLRALFPQTQSILMDVPTLGRWRELTAAGTGKRPEVPPHLTGPEREAFEQCRDGNLRLEQERIPQHSVSEALCAKTKSSDAADRCLASIAVLPEEG